MKRNIEIDTDTGFCNEDEGGFRSLQLNASGENLGQLIDSATIWEVDQDGGDTGRNYSIYDARNEVTSMCEAIIAEAYLNSLGKAV